MTDREHDAIDEVRHEDPAAEEAAALLALSLEPVAPPEFLRDRLAARLAAPGADWRPAAEIRKGAGVWKPTGVPGIDFQLLYADPKSGLGTYLLRMAPGSRYPAHRHFDNEQCLLLEGDLRWGAVSYQAGDFLVSGDGSVHPEVTTQGGNVQLIISGKFEFLSS
jgi:anti-sigma factor ChrR (cupin superfamily)